MTGLANPNEPCCSSCGEPGAVESFVLYRFELICAGCHESHEAARHAEGCGDCGATGVPLEETAGGDLLCAGCMGTANENAAERAEHAANESYYGGGSDAAVYARNAHRRAG